MSERSCFDPQGRFTGVLVAQPVALANPFGFKTLAGSLGEEHE